MCQGRSNSHYFHIGDKLINPIVGVFIPTIRIAGGMTIPNIATFDHGTYDQFLEFNIVGQARQAI